MTEGKPTVLNMEEGREGEVGNIANSSSTTVIYNKRILTIDTSQNELNTTQLNHDQQTQQPQKKVRHKRTLETDNTPTLHHKKFKQVRAANTFNNLQEMLDELQRNPIVQRRINTMTNIKKKIKPTTKKLQQNTEHSHSIKRVRRQTEEENNYNISQPKRLKKTKETRLSNNIESIDNRDNHTKNKLDKMAKRIRTRQILKHRQQQQEQEEKRKLQIRKSQQSKRIEQIDRENLKIYRIARQYHIEREGMKRWLQQAHLDYNNTEKKKKRRLMHAPDIASQSTEPNEHKKHKKKGEKQITLDKWFPHHEKTSTQTPARILPPRQTIKPIPKRVKEQEQKKTKASFKLKIKLAHKIRIATLNCPGIAAISDAGRTKRKTIRMYCRQNHIDILAIQETHTINELSKLSSFFPYRTFSSKISTSVGGVAFIIFNNKIQVTKHMDAQDGNMYSITIEYKMRTVTIVNIYAPMTKIQQQQFFIQHIGLWDPNQPIMFLGDWNFVEHPQEDTRGRDRAQSHTPVSSFQHLHQFYNLIDMTAIKNSKIQMTRWDITHASGARLDRIYVSSLMSHWVMATHNEAIPCTLNTSARNTISDHNIVAITLSASNTPKGEGYWKMNTQILKSVELQHKIIELIRTYLNDGSNRTTLFRKYEILKGNIQSALRDWSKQRAKKIHQEKNECIKKIEQYTQTIEDQQQKQIWKETAVELLITREKLAQIQQETAQGAWVRSRAKWDFQADKSTKMYFNLERAHHSAKNITSIRKKNRQITQDPQEITKQFRQFYRTLYTYQPIHQDKLDELLENLTVESNIIKEHRTTKMVDREEILIAINDTERGSSPGPDGIPIEFYKTFRGYWAIVLQGIYLEIDKKGRLPTSMTESFITLLPKHTSDKQDVANWRPISLLNSDYKILTKVWANRLNPILQEGIGPHQTGFIPGRDIRGNIILTQTTIDRMVEQNSPGGILLIDWAKAYDKISHEAIWAVAEKIGIPKHGQRFLKAIYRNPVSWILCNGFMSRVIKIGSGVRQGCPLSPQIFTLVAELYNQNIIKNGKIQGFKINDRCYVKIVSYADDTAIPFISIEDIKECMRILTLYEKATASKMNITKTCFVACQHKSHINKYLQNKGYRIQLPGTNTRYLGMPIGVNPNYDSTWDELKKNIYKELRKWHKICTSIYGRAIILKSKGLGQLWFVTTLLPINTYAQQTIKEIQKECTNFFWSYKGHKLRYANLMGTPEQGGFKLWDLQDKILSLQLKWMTKFENPQVKAMWKLNVAQILNNHQTKYQIAIPHSHSKTEQRYKLYSPMVENFLLHWRTVLDRTPLELQQDKWVASLSEQEIPQYIYSVRDTHEWNTDTKQNINKEQEVPLIDLLWYNDNNINNTPIIVREYAHTLVPVDVVIHNSIVVEAIATFPPVQFMIRAPNKKIQLIAAMNNKDYYVAMQSLKPRGKKKEYKWPNIAQHTIQQAFKSNHKGNESANIRQTRWLVLTHSLPVGSRIHKMNKKLTDQCPFCNQKETIRHCLYTCQNIAPIWQWFAQMWKAITDETLPNMTNNNWICNNIQSKSPTQLREICNIISHSIWLNRNKKIFHNKELLNTTAMICNVTTRWNIHIRAQIHTDKMKHEQAIYYNQTLTSQMGWNIIWQRIQNNNGNTKEWTLLRATTGDTYTTALLHNKLPHYSQNLERNSRNTVLSQRAEFTTQKLPSNIQGDIYMQLTL